MKKSLIFGALVGICAISIFGIKAMSMSTRSLQVLRVGYPYHWGTLVPPLQHTLYAETILRNEFEPLVRETTNGSLEPLAAESWELAEDFKTITFKIDRTKAFSNGEQLSSKHFKRAWEIGLGLTPASYTSSVKDVLCELVGFDAFQKTGEISGIKADTDDRLELHFNRPFRMALQYLSGARYAAFVQLNGRYLGTGRYIGKESAEKKLLLEPNPFNQENRGFSSIEISVVAPKNASESLSNGTVSLYAFAETAEIKSCDGVDSSNIACVAGPEASHSVLVVNGLKDRFFSQPSHRRALQSLLVKSLPVIPKPQRYGINHFRVDPQIFLPIQSGRLESEEIKTLTSSDERAIADLVEASKLRPITLITADYGEWLQEFLQAKGVALDSKSGKRDFPDRAEMYYKSFEPDLMLISQGVSSGDPDGIYHALGKHGAINSPMILREDTTRLLEEGRSIIDLNKMDAHYKKVSRAVLREVPFVHLGFFYTTIAIRKDLIQFSNQVKQRDDFRLHVFAPN